MFGFDLAASRRTPRTRCPRAVLAAACLMLLAPPAVATTMRPQNLADLVTHAQTIVIGTVETVTDGFDDRGVPYTEVTIRVAERIRGGEESQVRFRQFGLTKPRTVDGRRYLGVSPDGWPRWQERERVMVFLARPAARTGLQTTVALDQGKMAVRNGRLENAAQNAGLFKDLQVSAPGLTGAQQAMLRTDRTPVEADAFVGLVRRAVNENWVSRGMMRHAN